MKVRLDYFSRCHWQFVKTKTFLWKPTLRETLHYSANPFKDNLSVVVIRTKDAFIQCMWVKKFRAHGTALNLNTKGYRWMLVSFRDSVATIQGWFGLNVGFYGRYIILHFICKVGQEKYLRLRNLNFISENWLPQMLFIVDICV
jgi:hypothetical protein